AANKNIILFTFFCSKYKHPTPLTVNATANPNLKPKAIEMIFIKENKVKNDRAYLFFDEKSGIRLNALVSVVRIK
ncbi:hypothetical protein, partial [Escherichia coli]|uniref:hypothetical protein n=1 Tax=Escherichia coli TaxID=562 RepID=UPI0019D69F95